MVFGLLSGGATASDDDGKPDSDTWDIEISQAFGKTIVINAWDTINFVNTTDREFTATFLAGGTPISKDDPAGLQPTRERGTYWDGTDVMNTGKLGKGSAYWVTVLERGTFEYYNILDPGQKGWVVAVPETKHIPNEGTPSDAAAIAGDPALKELVEANK